MGSSSERLYSGGSARRAKEQSRFLCDRKSGGTETPGGMVPLERELLEARNWYFLTGDADV
jgi:hypothetical protein